MLWKMAVVAVIYCSFGPCAAQRRSRALYPTVFRAKRGTVSMVNPIFQNSVDEVNLLFEILLTGLWMENENSGLTVLDEELASLRQTGTLRVIYEHILPRKLTEVHRLTSYLRRPPAVLRREDFERTVLTMVYAAHRTANASGHQREVWSEAFADLYKAIKRDLTTK